MVAASLTVDKFLQSHPKGLIPKGSAEGDREWDQLIDLYKTSGDVALLKLAFLSQPKTQIQGAARAMVFWDLFMLKPMDFIQGANTIFSTLDCVMPILIPQTQFMPYSVLKKKLEQLKPTSSSQQTLLTNFMKRAEARYAEVKSGKVFNRPLKCP